MWFAYDATAYQSRLEYTETSNSPPTLTLLTSPVDTTSEDTEVEVSFADLTAAGDENDVDGTVDAFIVKTISSGTLKIGAHAGSATAWTAGTNDTIDATNSAYWTPAGDATAIQNAFAVVAEDNLGAESTVSVTAQIFVTAVNDPPLVDLNGSDGTGNDYSTSFNEGDAPVTVTDTDAMISDVDHATYNSLTVTLTGALNGLEERIRFGGQEFKATEVKTNVVTVGSTDFQIDYNGSDFVVSRDGGGVMGETDLQSLIRSLTYENQDNNPLDGIRTFTFVLQDAAGTNSTASTATILVNTLQTISGTVYEDINGDGDILDDGTDSAGVTVNLYVDDGAIVGEIDGSDSFVTSDTTDVTGGYTFAGLSDDTYWVVVDSASIDPDAGFNGGYSSGDAWAEQTYGVAGSVSFAGSYSYAATAGAFYGGKQSEVSDDVAALTTAEHVTRVIVSGSDVSNVDSGFSFNVITNTGDDGAATSPSIQGSLRQFILNSNAIDNTLHGLNSSQFAIPTTDSNYNGSGNGEFTITPTAVLPNITDSVVLDGTTQAGFAGTPIIEINGSAVALGDQNGLTLQAGGSTVRGFVINRFLSDGIEMELAGGSTIEGNYIGTDVTGTLDRGNGYGISVKSNGNTIGGTTSAQRNIISASNAVVDGWGIGIYAAATGNQVLGNYIGTDVTGAVGLGNAKYGIAITGANNNQIGGTVAGAGNIISGNNGDGIHISGAASTGNTIQGNYIGLNATGTAGVGNLGNGIRMTGGATNNTVGGTTAAARNVISANTGDGLNGDADGNTIQGNYIGTDKDGTAGLGNWNGIQFFGGASNNLIGGSTAGAGNLVSGNNNYGITITGASSDSNRIQGNLVGTNFDGTSAIANNAWGVSIETGAQFNVIGTDGDGSGDASERNVISGNGWAGVGILSANDNVIAGNYIGLTASGLAALGNLGDGIYLFNSSNTRIGTDDNAVSDTLERNVISANGDTFGQDHGIEIGGAGSFNNTVSGNYLGTDAAGSGSFGNFAHGVYLRTGANNNQIGGTTTDLANKIAHSGGAGIALAADAGVKNRLLGNSIHSNAGLGIDLGNDGVTLNDGGPADDADAGPNQGMNFPQITSAVTDTTNSITIDGLLDGLPGTDFDIEFYYTVGEGGEGENYLGTTVVTTNPSGVATFTNVTFTSVAVPDLAFITATATATNGADADNTSEFSEDFQTSLVNNPPTVSLNGVITMMSENFDTTFGVKVADIVITDDGVGTNDLTLSGADAGLFEIVLNELWLQAGTALDHETNGTLDVIVEVDDTAVGVTPDDTASLSITITDVNEAPTATDDSGATFTTDEDTSFTTGNALANDTDPDISDTLSVTGINTAGTTGLVTDNGDGTFSYDPNGQFESLAVGETATDSFTYTISDGNGGTDTATVTITVSGANDGPTASDDTGVGFATNEDVSFTTGNVLTNDTDPDQDGSAPNDVLSVLAADVASAAGATITNLGNGTFTYNAGAIFSSLAVGETATDSFTYTISDGNGGTDSATVTVTINGQNDDPVAVADGGATFTTDKNTAFTTGDALANDSDPDSTDVPTVAGIDLTGTLGLVIDNGNGTFDYDPNGQFAGLGPSDTATDTFTYTIDDGNGGTSTATVTITITGVNTPPTAADDSGAGFAGSEDAAFTTGDVLANDSDPDPQTLSVLSIDTTGTLGTVTNNGDGTFTFDPNGQFESLAVGETATDSFSYIISDGNGGTDSTTVTITINGRNDGPTANGNSGAGYITAKDTAFTTASALGNDTDPDTSDTVSVVSIDTTGTLGTVLDNGDGTFDYDPNGQFNTLGAGDTATDTFTYTISDGHGGTDTAVVTMTITGVNNPPTANNDGGALFTTDENTGFLTGDALANDTDLNPSDILSVTGINTAGTTGLVTDNGDGTFTYDPNGQFETLAVGETATDSFTYTISDGKGGTDTATVTITINGRNDGPTAIADGFATDEDISFTTGNALANDADPDTSDTVSVTGINTAGTTGLVTDNGDGTFTYHPNGQFESLAVGETATDTFSYTISDGNGGTDTATVTITINGVNDGPTATADGFATDEDTSFTTGNALTNDTDPDTSDTLSVTGINTAGTTGLVTDNGDGTFTYDPNGQFESLAVGETATDTFSYTLSDGNGGTDSATVTITINGANDGPTGVADGFATDEDTSFTTGNALANDTDPDNSDTLSVTGISTAGTSGLATDNGDGTFTYDPHGQFEGLAVGETATDTFSYTVSDGNGGTDTATVTVTIKGVNDGPTAVNDATAIDEDAGATDITAALLASDIDPDTNDTLAITAVNSAGTLGTVTLAAGVVSYDPDGQFEILSADETATDTFSYTVDDGNGGTDTATVTVTINGADDSPISVSVDEDPEPTSGDSSSTTDEGSPETFTDDLQGGDDVPADEPTDARDRRFPFDASRDNDDDREVVASPDSSSAIAEASIQTFSPMVSQTSDPAFAVSTATASQTAAPDLPADRVASGLIDVMNELRDEVDNDDVFHQAIVGSTLAVSTSLSVGYVVWLIRGGVLMSSVLSSMPAWRMVDPLPVLGYLDDEEEDTEDDSLESLVTKSNTKRVGMVKP